MSKKRLKNIKKWLNRINNASTQGFRIDEAIKIIVFDKLKVEWLVERVQELEEDVDRLNRALHYQLTQENIKNEKIRKLSKENKRIKQMKYHEAYEQGKFDTNMKVWYELPKLEREIERYREIIQDFIDCAEDYNISKVEKYNLQKEMENQNERI